MAFSYKQQKTIRQWHRYVTVYFSHITRSSEADRPSVVRGQYQRTKLLVCVSLCRHPQYVTRMLKAARWLLNLQVTEAGAFVLVRLCLFRWEGKLHPSDTSAYISLVKICHMVTPSAKGSWVVEQFFSQLLWRKIRGRSLGQMLSEVTYRVFLTDDINVIVLKAKD